MGEFELVDTFPEFQRFWKKWRTSSTEEQIEAWAGEYMAHWPELLEKQVVCYSEEGENWRIIATEHVFPFLDGRLSDMELAHKNLLECGSTVYDEARKRLGFDFDIVQVIYSGIGCGAGWATSYQRRPAVLLGLENIAECGWIQLGTLRGLIAHEIGHLAHYQMREKAGMEIGSGPWWQLYEEGYAQRCEALVQGDQRWHMVGEPYGENWLQWCQQNRTGLALEFLRRVDQAESIRPFFGSWYEVMGHKQCGYFLGHEAITTLEKKLPMEEIALLERPEERLRPIVEAMADMG